VCSREVDKIDRFAERVFEALFVCLLAAGILLGISGHYEPMIRAGRETALQLDLTTMRTAIQAYTLREGHPPPDIALLLKDGHLMVTAKGTIFVPPFLQSQALDPGGYLVDPFGARFSYEPSKGTVRSTTRGYENW
jgi:hypothetical protein